jgi:Mg-chelatase subunit ChlD
MHPNQFGNPLPVTRPLEEDRVGAARPVVRLLVILDKSLSMAEHEERVTTSLRSFVDTLASAPNQPRYVVTLVGFSNEAETLLQCQPIETLAINYKADGESTALWDAMAHGFTLEKSRREHVVCLIVSDGEDNASTAVDQKQVAAMVRSRQEWGNWTIVWLNLQGKPSKSARTLGINCIDSTRDQINESLPAVASQISRVGARLAGGARKLSIEGQKR